MMNLFAINRMVLAAVVWVVSVGTVWGQEDGTNGPPNVLVIQREYTKPGKGGSEHARTEGDYARAMAAAKAPAHYFAMTALSGPDRVLYFSGYASFADWDATNTKMSKDEALDATLDRLNIADGEMVASSDESVWMKRADQSLNSGDRVGNLEGKRYMQIEQFKVKPGHGGEWDEVMKTVMEGYSKGFPGGGFTTYQQMYGTGGLSYIVLIPLKELGDVDQMFAQRKAFSDALGKEGLKKLEEMEASCLEEEETNLFHFSPGMSYVPDTWVKADPDFWKSNAPVVVKKKVVKRVQ